MNILVPLEDEASEQLVLPVCEELPLADGSITLVHVAGAAADPLSVTAAEAVVARTALTFRRLCPNVQSIVRIGDAATQIAALADEVDADLIVMHARPPTHRGRQRASVTEQVLTRTRRPAIAVRDRSRHPANLVFARVALGVGSALSRPVTRRPYW